MLLPNVIIYNILCYNNTEYIKYIRINKLFKKLFKKKVIKNVVKIQNYYKKNRVSGYYGGGDLDSLMRYHDYCRYVNLLKPKIYYRKVLLFEQDQHLRRMPERIISRIPITSSRYLILRHWIKNYLNNNIDERNRSEIKEFFYANRIRVEELMSIGV